VVVAHQVASKDGIARLRLPPALLADQTTFIPDPLVSLHQSSS